MEHQEYQLGQVSTLETSHPSEGTIIGDVILGDVNPQTLSEDEFNQSPKTLYHGAAKSFIYSHKGEYDSEDTGGDGSSDYGMGLYTTDIKLQAENYSYVRSRGLVEKPIIYTFMPHQAKMLDVRDATSPDNNGFLPKAFVEQWSHFLKEYLSNDKNFNHIHPSILRFLRPGAIKDFLQPVEKSLADGESMVIRNDGKNKGIFNYEGNGFLSGIFSKFMISLGYDGMIYREGGEGEHGNTLTGFVFYNYEAVDTWNGWKNRLQPGE